MERAKARLVTMIGLCRREAAMDVNGRRARKTGADLLAGERAVF